MIDWEEVKMELMQRFSGLREQISVMQEPGALSEFNPLGWIKSLIGKFSKDHLPILDHDGDKFGAVNAGFRGYNWKGHIFFYYYYLFFNFSFIFIIVGRDCNDSNAEIYPGRKVSDDEKGTDYNCIFFF